MAPTAYTSYVLEPHYKAVQFNTGITMDPKMGVTMRFKCTSHSKENMHA